MKRIELAFVVMLIPVVSWSLQFEEVVENAGLLYEDRLAALNLREAEAQVTSAGYRGDISMNIQPDVQVITPFDGSFAEGLTIDGAVSVAIPLGLSDERKRDLKNATAAVSLADQQLSTDHSDALFRLWSSYQSAWLAQEGLAVLEQEVEAAYKEYKNSEELFQSGAISLAQLQQSDERLRDNQAAHLEGELHHRISWLELSYMADLDPTDRQTMDRFAIASPSLPKPPELTLWALDHDAQILDQQEKIRQLRDRLDSGGFDVSSTVRTNLAAAGHGVSVTYNSLSKGLSGTYTFPVATIGVSTEGGSGSSDTWTVGLAINLSVSGRNESQIENEIISISLEQENARLEALEESLGLEIRTSYQKYVLRQETLQQAKRTLEAVSEQTALVRTLYAEKRATEAEMLSAAARLARASYQVTEAEVWTQESLFLAAASASYLSELMDIGGE